MKKVAVFGKPGGGKSTLSRKLALATGLELCSLDLIEYKKNGERVAPELFSEKHADWVAADSWIIDGLGSIPSFWARIDAADTLVYVDLPYRVHYWWVTKRYLKSFVVKPEGWPEGCSVLKGTLAGWKVLKICPTFWTQELFEKIQARAKGKESHRITSVEELNKFVNRFS
jgi:adenylate kinase family enzyme